MASILLKDPKEMRVGQDNATIVRGFVDEVITKGNIEAAAQYVWEDVVEQVPCLARVPDLTV